MSKTVRSELGCLDTTVLTATAERMGLPVSYKAPVRLYGTTGFGDVVIRLRSGYDLGIVEKEDGSIDLLYDDMTSREVNDLLSEYTKDMVEEKSNGEWEVINTNKVGDKVRLSLRRRN